MSFGHQRLNSGFSTEVNPVATITCHDELRNLEKEPAKKTKQRSSLEIGVTMTNARDCGSSAKKLQPKSAAIPKTIHES